MTLEEKLTEFMTRRAVLHTPTWEIYHKLMNILGKRGITWVTGELAIRCDIWEEYREDTVIVLMDGTLLYDAVETYPKSKVITLSEDDFSLDSYIHDKIIEINGNITNHKLTHTAADDLLCDILGKCGYHELVDWFHGLDKQ